LRRETVELRGSTAIGAEGIEFFSDELAWDIQEEIPNDSADCRCSSASCAVADGLQDHLLMVLETIGRWSKGRLILP